MTRKSIYLLVPQKGIKGFTAGIDPAKIKVVAGRGNAERQAVAMEKELNGGFTWKETLEKCKSKDELETHSTNCWQVHYDTDRSWSDFKQYDSWPIHDEVERLLAQ